MATHASAPPTEAGAQGEIAYASDGYLYANNGSTWVKQGGGSWPWVNFNGSPCSGAGNTCTIRSSYKVNKVVRLGSGHYQIYWDTNFSDANYAIFTTVGNSAWGETYACINKYDVQSVSSAEILCGYMIYLNDWSYISVMAMGNQ